MTHSPRSLQGEIFLSPQGSLCLIPRPPRPWLTGPPAAADGPARLRGSLGRCLPPDPRQTDGVADSGVGTGDRVDIAGHLLHDRQARRM